MSNILPIGKWGWVLAGSWVEWLVMLPKVLRQAQDERGVGSVVWFAFCRAGGALLQGSSREWFFGVFCVLPECAQKIRHQPVSGFAAGRDACGRAWGQEAPARPGESRWRLGPGCGSELGYAVGYDPQGLLTGSGRTGGSVRWLVMLPKVLRQAQDERGLG